MIRTVGIAGAGLAGRLLAYLLARDGLSVTIFEKSGQSDRTACGYAAGGMLSPLAELAHSAPQLLEAGYEAIEIWRKLSCHGPDAQTSTADQATAAIQPDVTGGSPSVSASPALTGTGFTKAGSLIVSHQSDASELNLFLGQIRDKLPGSFQTRLRLVDREELKSLTPGLARTICSGVFIEDEAHINPVAAMDALNRELHSNHVCSYYHTPVVSVTPGVISTERKNFTFDLSVDCRGVGAKVNWQEVRAVRGEALVVHAPELNISRPVRLLHPRYPLYVVPRGDDTYYLGASQIECEDYSPISVQTTLELLNAAYSLSPAFAEARIKSTITNCRPALADNLPQIRLEDGLVRLNGLFRHGYLLAPKFCAEITRFIQGCSFDSTFEAFFVRRLTRAARS